jgi:protein gp37
MTRMFKSVTMTWNPYTGCRFDCSYCWARELVETKLRDSPKYRECGFAPTFHPKELHKRFKPGEFVFVSDMGDIYWIDFADLGAILFLIRRHPETFFLIQSKAPEIFLEWGRLGIEFPPNIYLATTIETNRDYELSNAPPPPRRFHRMCLIDHPHKFVSIEPIMDFDLDVMLKWMKEIKPEIIEVGADNHGHNLPEPSWDKVERLLAGLRQICPKVVEKDGLERLKGSPVNYGKANEFVKGTFGGS